jgi:hypothetical protein
MNNSYAKEIVQNTYTGGYPMSVFLEKEEMYRENMGVGGGSAAPSLDFNKIRFENLVIPLGIDSHVNLKTFVPESYHTMPMKTIDSSIFDSLFEKIATIQYPKNNSNNKTKKKPRN